MMRTTTCLLAILLTLTITSCGKKSEVTVYEDGDFVEMMDSLDLNASKNTSLNIKTKWTELKGKEVEWEGEVVDVKGGRGRVVINIKKDGKPLYQGYNVVVTTFDEAKAGKLKKGDDVTFKGMLESMKQRRGNPLIIYVGSAQIVE